MSEFKVEEEDKIYEIYRVEEDILSYQICYLGEDGVARKIKQGSNPRFEPAGYCCSDLRKGDSAYFIRPK